MKIKILILFTIILSACFSSSEEGRIKKPDHFLKQDKMVEVTVDFRLTEAAIRQMAGYGENTKVLSKYYYKKVLEKHHITADIYKANLAYYSKHPDELHQIYSRVVARLTEIQTELATQK